MTCFLPEDDRGLPAGKVALHMQPTGLSGEIVESDNVNKNKEMLADHSSWSRSKRMGE